MYQIDSAMIIDTINYCQKGGYCVSQRKAKQQPDHDSELYAPLDSLDITDFAEGQTVEHASNEAFHAFAGRAFTSLKNTEPKDWQDRYLRWVAVNRMLSSKRVIRKKKDDAPGWVLCIISERQSEEKASTSEVKVEEKASELPAE